MAAEGGEGTADEGKSVTARVEKKRELEKESFDCEFEEETKRGKTKTGRRSWGRKGTEAGSFG